MTLLQRLTDARLLQPIDLQVASLLRRASASPPEITEAVEAAAAWASASARDGHVCVDLASAPQPIADDGGPATPLLWPTLDQWRQRLSASPLVSDGATAAPLVWAGPGRLYLHRLWAEEQDVAQRVRVLAMTPSARPAPTPARLAAYFPDDALDQRRAAEVQSRASLTLLCGGPGTGKTTTVCRMLALAIESALGAAQRPPRILLLAPTGKAAARLGEAVARNRASALIPDAVRAHIPSAAQTLHRAIGLRADGGPPRHGVWRPLPFDLVVVDEASMIDLELMGHLVRALPPGAQLVLIGDRHQLASVEAGAVLGELSRAARLAPCLVELTHNRRFAAGGAIGELARAIVEGDREHALAVLRSSREARLIPPRRARKQRDVVIEEAAKQYGRALTATTVEAALAELGTFRVIAAHRRGSSGAEGLCRRIERALLADGKVRRAGDQVLGRPLLILANDPTLRLANGDLGVTWLLDDGVRACFPDGAGHRALAPSRLPAHDAVYAMTVHKSQGSEWRRVMLVLPDEPSPILTRELLYTAVTRASEELTICGSAELIAAAIARPTTRLSGLAAAIDATDVGSAEL